VISIFAQPAMDTSAIISPLTKSTQPTLFATLSNEMRLRNYSHKTVKAYKNFIHSYLKFFLYFLEKCKYNDVLSKGQGKREHLLELNRQHIF